MRLTGSLVEPELAFLPWSTPLEEWPEDLVVALPRGISRHIVRFVRINGVVYAIKEVEEHYATREYELLFDLVRRGLPTVEPIGVVLDRSTDDDEPLPSGLITRHLELGIGKPLIRMLPGNNAHGSPVAAAVLHLCLNPCRAYACRATGLSHGSHPDACQSITRGPMAALYRHRYIGFLNI